LLRRVETDFNDQALSLASAARGYQITARTVRIGCAARTDFLVRFGPLIIGHADALELISLNTDDAARHLLAFIRLGSGRVRWLLNRVLLRHCRSGRAHDNACKQTRDHHCTSPWLLR